MKKWQVLAFVVELGFTVGFSILIGIGVGWWLDGKLGTRPIFTLIGLFLGLASAGYNLYRLSSVVRK
ncbi:MAG: AtpZ/AtpI family protein [Anaerolineae bacterium]|nr:AtpZ/AtpI family protein [Anaerolineae bacterium]MDW8101300.1 AtpZ/AtpI family protein [Anaerolineae bacterium]